MKPYYQKGGQTIYLGDCRELLPKIGKCFDLILTDPPYGIFACGGKWGRKADLQWDKEAATQLDSLLFYSRNQIIWGGNYFSLPLSRGWLVWYKRDSVQSAADAELAWTSFDMNTRLIDHTIAATNAERNGHPTKKPLRVITWCLSFAIDAKSVVDPYMGSGTTLRAAKNLGIEAVGIEIEEKYAEIAARTLEQGVLEFEPRA